MRKLFFVLLAVSGVVFLCRCNLPTFAGMLTEETLTFATPKGYAAPVPIVRSSWEDRIPSDSPALSESPSLAAPVVSPPVKPSSTTAASAPTEKTPAKIFKSAKSKSRKHTRFAKRGKKPHTHIARR